jgi:beta-lactamase regulating signal transducer with metallopeptidase domain
VNSWISAVNAASSIWLDAILRAAWQGAIALAIVWIVSRCLAALPATWKVWLWRLAFLKLLVALVWVTPVSLPVLPAGEQTPSLIASPAAPVSEPVGRITESSPAIFAATKVHLDCRSWLLVLWSVGVMWALVRILRQWRSAKMLLRGSAPMTDPLLHNILIRLGKALRLRHIPTVHQSSLVCSPLLIGVFRPRIILPAGTSCDAYLELMLAHELAHVRRRDLCWLWLFTLCEAAFFFHPLVWLARREWTLSTEAACDQLALSAANRGPHDYGSMLVQVVAGMAGRRAPAVMSIGMYETANTLKRRLKAMTTNRSRLSTAIGLALVALATLALVPCRLVAETPDAETLMRLREENVKLHQQLEATRGEMEFLRQKALAAKESDESFENKRRAQEQLQKSAKSHREATDGLRLAQRQLAELLNQFTEQHPSVLAKRKEIEMLQALMQRESSTLLDMAGPRVGKGEKFVPATPEQIARSREHRDLLAREIELAEKQAEFVRKNLEAGKEIAENLLRVHREVLELKLKQAELSGSKAEVHAVLIQQLQVAEQFLKDIRKRIEVGVMAPGAELAFEREVLRLKRELATSVRGGH